MSQPPVSQPPVSQPAAGAPAVRQYRVTYTDTASELLEADRVDVEAGAWLVLRRTVHVVGRPREVVVRRIAAATVRRVEEVAGGRAAPAGRADRRQRTARKAAP